MIDPAAESRLVAFKQRFSLSECDPDHNGAHTRLVQAAPKKRTVVWGLPKSKYLEDKVRREYIGASKGVDIRVMKGVYYHVGAFK